MLPVDDERRDPLVLQGSAGVLWDLLAEPVTLERLSEQLAARYGDVEASQVAADVAPVLHQLVDVGVIDELQ